VSAADEAPPPARRDGGPAGGRDIDKLAWLHVEGRRLLAARTRGRPACYLPGGKREAGESDAEALLREIREELSVTLRAATLERVGVFRAPADGQPEGVHVALTCYRAAYDGEIVPAAEIEAVAWLSLADRARCSPAGRLVLDYAHAQGWID
jgi:8-oxo-dGTP diphosphatase